MKNIDIGKLRNNKEFIQGSTKESLKDVIPIQWTDDVLNGNKKVIIVSTLDKPK